jgi:hypothetical protein
MTRLSGIGGKSRGQMIRVEAIRHYIQASHQVRCTASVGLILHGLSIPLYTYSTTVRYITLQYTAP